MVLLRQTFYLQFIYDLRAEARKDLHVCLFPLNVFFVFILKAILFRKETLTLDVTLEAQDLYICV